MSAHVIKYGAILFLGIILLFAGYVAIIKPAQQQLASLEQQQIILKTQAQKQQVQINNIAQYERQIRKISAYSSWYKKQLVDITLPLLLDQLAKVAAVSHATLQAVQPVAKKQTAQFSRFSLQISVQGSYQQISAFIANLIDDFTFVALPNIKLTKTKIPNNLSLQILCITYGKL
ncbi:MAG: type 4a pilus biogenesis protein PilO [Gammaproteobacteria bacterium]|nr:type 4a pilus biogenesis protein PilO [Gammaproteobacteria bacterium]